MTSPLLLYRTTIGKKVVMAVTGLILLAFVFAHMIGNLEIYRGQEHFNAYALFLREVGGPILAHGHALWIIRIILLVSVVLHILAAVQLTRQSWAARPISYAQRRTIEGSYASRTMRWGGVIIFLFVIYHLLHFTFGTAHPQFVRENVHLNVVNAFRSPIVSLVYIAAMIVLGLHIYHGFWSMFQTFGLNNSKWSSIVRGVAIAVALAISVGNISVPVAVMLGWVD